MVQIWETVFSVPVPVPVPDFRVRSKKCVTLNLPFLNRPYIPIHKGLFGDGLPLDWLIGNLDKDFSKIIIETNGSGSERLYNSKASPVFSGSFLSGNSYVLKSQ